MARKGSIINVVVAGNTKPLRKSLGKATQTLTNFSKKVGQVSVAAGAAFVGIGAKAVDLAVDFEESLSKAQQIFGDAAVGIENWAKTSATSVGMAQSEYLEAASSFGVFGKAAGLNGDLLAEFSDELVTVAADVASFNNLRPEEALEKLQAGLRGSNEPLQSIGVLLNAAMVEAKALEMGLGDANGEISEGNKIMARQALILEKLGEQGALGDFARTSGGLANQTRIMKARFKDLGITLGRVLIPIAEKASRFIGKLLTVGEKLAEVYKEKGFKGLFQALVDGLMNLRGQIITKMQEIAPKVGKAIKVMAPILAKALLKTIKQNAKIIAKLANAFVDWIRPKIRPMLSRLLEFMQAAGNFILQKLPFIADKVGQLAAKFIEWITPLTKKLLQKLPTIIKTIVEFIVTKAIPKIVEAGLKLASHLVPALLSFGQAVLEGIGSIIAQVGGAIGRGFANMGSYALQQAGAFGNKILDAIMRPINFMGGLARTAFDAVVGAFKTGYNALARTWNATIGGFGFTVPDWLKYTGLGAPIAGKEFRIPPLTELATGGIVTRPTAALIGEAGPEAVIPLNKMGAMGGNITINMPVGANGEDIVRALERYTRQQGNLQLPVSNTVRR